LLLIDVQKKLGKMGKNVCISKQISQKVVHLINVTMTTLKPSDK